ncbi:hypothetical protein BCR44DRAFT_73528, partial [Catenaria anguillulae PL171]
RHDTKRMTMMNANELQSLLSLWAVILDHHDLSPAAGAVQLGDDTPDHVAQLWSPPVAGTNPLAGDLTATATTSKRNGSANGASQAKQLTAMSARFASLVNSLLAASKSDAARLTGMLLVQIWLEQVPQVVREVSMSLSWANALLTIVSRTVDPIPLRIHASTLLSLLVATAARFPDSSRDVAAPTVAKFAPNLNRWTLSSGESSLALQRAGLTAISRLAIATPTSIRPFALSAQSNAHSLLHTPSLQTLAARTIARLVPLAAKGDAPAAWSSLLTQALATCHGALDVVLAPLDEDEDTLPPSIHDASLLPGTPKLPVPEPTLSPSGARLATSVFASAASLVSHLISTRLPSSALVAIPTALLLQTTGRILCASSLAPLPTAPAASAATAHAQVPLLAVHALRDLVLPLIRSAASCTALASLASHSTTLGSLLLRALHSTPAVRAQALAILSAGAAHILSIDSLAKSLGTPQTTHDLHRACPATLAAVSACIHAHGSRVPTHVRSQWDAALVPGTLSMPTPEAVSQAAQVSAMIPSVVAAHGVPAYSTLALVGYAASGRVAREPLAAAVVDALVHPRRVADVQPVFVVQDKVIVGGGQAQVEAGKARGSMFVDPSQIAAQLVEGAGAADEDEVEDEDDRQQSEERQGDQDAAILDDAMDTEPALVPAAVVVQAAPVLIKSVPAPAAPSMAASAPLVKADTMQVDNSVDMTEGDDDEDLMEGIEIVDSGPDSDDDE